MSDSQVIALVGATGIVGSEVLCLLEQSAVPMKELRLFASEESEGEVYGVRGDESVVDVLRDDSFEGVDVAFFTVQEEIARTYIPQALKAGACVIDSSGAYRLDDEAPLIVPGVNFSDKVKEAKLITSPGSLTIQLVPVLKAIHEAAGLKRVIISTYQAVSGAGKEALDELWEQTRAVFTQQEMPVDEFEHQIAFNCIPQIDEWQEGGYTKEEKGFIDECRKVLGIDSLAMTVTSVMVPVFHGHGQSVNIETEKKLSASETMALLEATDAIQVYPSYEYYPMPTVIVGDDRIHVGRIREDTSTNNALNMWVVADNIRRGSALNLIKILERVSATHN